jgi:uncharacterized protein
MPRNYQQAKPAEHQRLPEYKRGDEWIRAFLGRSQIGHVAHAMGEQPFITPTNFWFDATRHQIVFHSNISGRIHSNLQNNPKVCFETSEYGHFLPANTALEFSTQYRSVMVFGKVEIIENDEEKQRLLYGLLKKYFPEMEAGREYRPITNQELARTTVYALQIETWSGKENWPQQAEQLPDWAPLPEKFLG